MAQKRRVFSFKIPTINVRNGYFNIPMSRKLKTECSTVKIPFLERLVGKNLNKVRVIPRYNVRLFEVEFITEEEPQPKVKSDNVDCNGAANIGVKSKLNGLSPDRCLGIFGYAIKGEN